MGFFGSVNLRDINIFIDNDSGCCKRETVQFRNSCYKNDSVHKGNSFKGPNLVIWIPAFFRYLPSC